MKPEPARFTRGAAAAANPPGTPKHAQRIEGGRNFKAAVMKTKSNVGPTSTRAHLNHYESKTLLSLLLVISSCDVPASL
jgi:hypothetical protein